MFLHIYYKVPACPNCGSPVTGRYVKPAVMSPGLAYEEALKHGELVTEVDKVPDRNCYCEDCGFEWHCYITASILTTNQLMEEKRKRGTIPRFDEYKRDNYVNGRRPKEPLARRLFL